MADGRKKAQALRAKYRQYAKKLAQARKAGFRATPAQKAKLMKLKSRLKKKRAG
ncbi:MAG TPA: hypothetical protein PKO38_04220 [Bacillota bacterium]|nr:hypothetical protein [Bacillota bacterium]HOB86877.1 hypothetical protein [Bacillota bacterium]HOP69365.1 hypothetical protein [Bacillota bacterium]HPT33708.1 hypothetical protein [Bacillota bacterium]HPZ64695.1 hypothetical protein [Bacillota bacterium]